MEIQEVRGGQEVECEVVNSRFKREGCHSHLRQHQHPFSTWKILVGPSDWEDHSKNKEGAERYRVHNLPNCSSCPGVYELGIALPWPHSTNKLNKDRVIPVYLGHADNVRTRLQHYGRNGAHLEDGRLIVDPSDYIQQGNRLFSEVFSKGFAIMYRWVPMESKQEAQKTEADLLRRYDFAWNKGNNDTRRHDDILRKLDEITYKETKSLSISRKIRDLCHSKVSAQFDPCKPLLLGNGSIICNNQERNDVFSQILKFGRSNPRRVTVTFGTGKDCADIGVFSFQFDPGKPLLLGNGSVVYNKQESNDVFSPILKFGRSNPRLVPVTFDTSKDCADTCGVVLGHGCVCTRPPVEGRKRCAEHKGMKINGLISKLIVKHKSVSGNIGEDPLPICGFTEENGYVCPSQIVPGRKRCEEHKGKKMKEQLEKSKVPPEKTVEVGSICGVNFEDGSFCTRQAVIGRERCEEHKGRKINSQSDHISKLVPDNISCSSKNSKPSIPPAKKVVEVGPSCGVNLEDGTLCARSPVEGRKRCFQHKGMRVTSEGSFSTSTSTYTDTKASSYMCGAALLDGSICRRVPVQGRKRCEQHKGMRVTNEGSLGTSTSTYADTGASSYMCGAALRDGSICRRVPVLGRKRCEQHKGMRVTSEGSLSTWTSTYADTRASSYLCGAGASSYMCGAALQNGSICHRVPVQGRKRCEQHKGMRATFW